MAGSSLKRDNLHNLVEATFRAHKRDIYDYASGHLNPSKLRQLPGREPTEAHVPWKSANVLKPKIRDLESRHSRAVQSRNTADEMLVGQLGLMKNALLDFSMGTTGSLASHKNVASKRKKSRKKPALASRCASKLMHSSKSEAKLEAMVMSEITKLMVDQEEPFKSSGSQNEEDQSHIATVNKKFLLQYPVHQSSYVEEIKLPELMLPAVNESARVPPSLKEAESFKQRVHQITDKKFVTTHLAGITRKDQFNKILDLDRNVLHRYETMEKKVRDGHKAVEHLEQKLVRNLLEMNIRDPLVHGLNFERLQVYGEVWQDLCSDSSIVGPVLSQLKEHYDLYLSRLLDEMNSANHAELVSCLNTVGENALTCDENEVGNIRETVEDLEEDSRQLLLRNADLHTEIARENARIEEERRQREQEEEDNRRRMIPTKTTSKKSVTQNTGKNMKMKREEVTEVVLKRLRVDVWEKLDTISELRNELKNGYVPKTVYRNYQHAVKDTEGDMQKLIQQIEYLNKNISEEEHLMAREMSRHDITGEDLVVLLDSLGL